MKSQFFVLFLCAFFVCLFFVFVFCVVVFYGVRREVTVIVALFRHPGQDRNDHGKSSLLNYRSLL